MLGRDAYRRTEKVLIKDKIGASPESMDAVLGEVEELLQKYMKVYDMHISFKVIGCGKYSVKIVGEVSNINIPGVV